MVYKHPLEIPRSDVITGFRWTGERVPYPVKEVHGDTHPMTWAADGEMYVSAGDPNWAMIDGKPKAFTWDQAIPRPEVYPGMGAVDIEIFKGYGADFHIERINDMPGLMGPGGLGPKPTGLISVKGSFYLAVQTLLGHKPPRHSEHCQHGTDATILRSDDFGKTWQPDIQSWWPEFEAKCYNRKEMKWITPPESRESWNGWKPMFPGFLFGGPSFIQYGRDNSDTVDGYVYAVSGDQWDNGSEMRIGRVPKEHILDINRWEWAIPQEDGGVRWTSDLGKSQPVLSLERHLSLPEMVYLPNLHRYILLTWALHKDFSTEYGSELTIMEAKHPWGPFRLVYYEEVWDNIEVCPYCPRIPLKWFDMDSMSGWIVHSGNWNCPNLDPWYRPHVRPFKLMY